jgi:hypothetical protein
LRVQLALISGAACLTLAASTPADAAAFLVINSTPDTWVLIDPSTVVRDPPGQHLTAWTVTVQRNLTNNAPPQPGYIRTLNDYDCGEWRLRWRSVLTYSRFGVLVMKKDNAFPEWAPVAGGGADDASLRVLCNGVGGGSVIAAGSIGQLVIGLMQAWDPPGGPEGAPAPAMVPPPVQSKAKPQRRSPR